MKGRCPKCGRGKIETWGFEMSHAKNGAVIGEVPAMYVCSRELCDWSYTKSVEELGDSIRGEALGGAK